jgi:hypothetical protein
MKNLRFSAFFFAAVILISSISCKQNEQQQQRVSEAGNFLIGWSQVDITPDKPVFVAGQFYARVSEGVHDPIYATAMALERGSGPASEKAIMITCDIVSIHDGMKDGSTDNLRDRVRSMIREAFPELTNDQIILNATHSHTAPYVSLEKDSKSIYGVELDAMSPAECMDFISVRIAKAGEQAWKNRKAGGVSYALGNAVVARNRLHSNFAGVTTKGGSTNRPDFSHIEGFEDHSLNLLYTFDDMKNLTGVVINIAADAQVTGGEFYISSDFWHETRVEIHKKLGDNVHVLAQCASAGDQGTLILVGAKAMQRMQQIMYPVTDTTVPERLRPRIGYRKQIAGMITREVADIYPYMRDYIDWDPPFMHRMEVIELSRRRVTQEDIKSGLKEYEQLKKEFDKKMEEINRNPEIRKKPRWYREVTTTHSLMKRGLAARDRYAIEKDKPKLPVEVHVIRLGDIAIATNPFELYLDYGMRIKARSAAIQTFVVQLAGSGSYLPPVRSVAGGAYGAVPASNLVGPEGGQELVEKTVEMINGMFKADK